MTLRIQIALIGLAYQLVNGVAMHAENPNNFHIPPDVMKRHEIVFHEDHILAVHDIHRKELVVGMDVADLRELARWVGELRRRGSE